MALVMSSCATTGGDGEDIVYGGTSADLMFRGREIKIYIDGLEAQLAAIQTNIVRLDREIADIERINEAKRMELEGALESKALTDRQITYLKQREALHRQQLLQFQTDKQDLIAKKSDVEAMKVDPKNTETIVAKEEEIVKLEAQVSVLQDSIRNHKGISDDSQVSY